MREPEVTIKTTEMRRLLRAVADKAGAKAAGFQETLTETLVDIGIKEELVRALFTGPIVENVTDSLAYSVNSGSRHVKSKAAAALQLAEEIQHAKARQAIYTGQSRAMELHTGETFDINLNALTALIQEGGDND